MACKWRFKDHLWESVLCSHHVHPWDWTQAVRLAGKCFYLLSHLSSFEHSFFIIRFILWVWVLGLDVWMCTCCLWMSEEDVVFSGTGVKDGCKPSSECWELNSDRATNALNPTLSILIMKSFCQPCSAILNFFFLENTLQPQLNIHILPIYVYVHACRGCGGGDSYTIGFMQRLMSGFFLNCSHYRER